MIEIIVPIGVFIIMGVLAGIILTVASKMFAVKIDDKIERILTCLPGIDCGACGFSGCELYAEAIVKGKTKPNLCKVGGAEAVDAIGKVLGKKITANQREVTFVHCTGNCDMTGDKFTYSAVKSCAASARYYGGKNECRYGCIGFGDCVDVCQFNAISVINGVAVVDISRCTACGMCIKTCPNNLIAFHKTGDTVQIACSSHDTGKITKDICKIGCIACKICEKKCPVGAIEVKENLAEIDYKKCTSCGICADVCPKKCIRHLPKCKL